MCDHDSRLPLGLLAVAAPHPAHGLFAARAPQGPGAPFWPAGLRAADDADHEASAPRGADDHDDDPPAPAGSRRHRLWELPTETHCALVGVCFGLDALRKLVGKATGGTVMGDDYEIHVGAVAECRSRNRLSEAMQRDLDRRHALVIRQWAALKTTEALAERWRRSVDEATEVAAALWVALTHPRCDVLLQERICRDIHMVQHQVGASERVDRASHRRVLAERAALDAELVALRDRSTALLRERAVELERANAELMRLRADAVMRTSAVATLEAELAELRASIPDLESRQRLGERARQLWERCREQDNRLAAQARELDELRAALTRARDELQQAGERERRHAPARARDEAPSARADAAGAAGRSGGEAAATGSTRDGAAPLTFRPAPVTVAVPLRDRAVLCVGGYANHVARYRETIEGSGARFLHHDGGVEDRQARLDSCLAAADLVICQTGCISHAAYWRVKDHCKRTGKRCVFVENPSVASLERSLSGLAEAE
ncbi:DUF2325 domain-containing protein [Derxia gummosa]|uniref:DUF2325 domain-containing protein n=1 Tax=Derxia gummosa DSM 723 TaxID=1121388 RepID=A0A9U5GFX6_9BURK|nr:DUF2325 domain-containing protein [Derxia gummosa]